MEDRSHDNLFDVSKSPPEVQDNLFDVSKSLPEIRDNLFDVSKSPSEIRDNLLFTHELTFDILNINSYVSKS